MPDAVTMPSARPGLQLGTVKQLAPDMNTLYPLLVTVAAPATGLTDVWAQYIRLYGPDTPSSGFFPKVGDKVVLGNIDSPHPVVLGTLYEGNGSQPDAVAFGVSKQIVGAVASGVSIQPAATDKIATIQTSGGNSIIVNDLTRTIEIKDPNGNSIQLSKSGINISSAKDITISAKGSINLDAMQKLSLSAGQDLTGKGVNVSLQANIGMTAKGNATAEFSASGQTTIKGGMVMIN